MNATHVYLVVAYRWGETNNHSYFVYAGMDHKQALELAELECQDRGGKYGVAAWEFTQDGRDYKLAGYFPSSAEDADTPEPRYNHGIDYNIRLGAFLNECASGRALLPDPSSAAATTGRMLTYQEVEIPDYMREKVDRETRLLRAMNDAMREVTKTEGKS